jgi:CDP-diacylglycerol--glycerol-3-phosphate 3-phosphatidyltransferase
MQPEATMNSGLALSTLVASGAVLLFLLAAVSGYAVRSLRVGRKQETRLERLGGTSLFGAWLMEAVYWAIRLPGRWLAQVGVHPDTLTWTSLVITLASAPIAASGHFSTAGLLFLVGAAFDALDGMVARQTGRASRQGAVLDSVLDRVADAAPLAGLVIFYRFSVWQMTVPLVAIVGGQLVSYVRAKAESMGLDLPSGLMRRHERVAYISGALIIAPMLSPVLGSPAGAVHPATLTILGLVAVTSAFAAWRLLRTARESLAVRDTGSQPTAGTR